ncbi:FUSC family protein [Pusillimonas sp. CC-YST705]|uniref:FUSC family protein n=1 Tax=Mesopusillimonas faecipullorum TaxID=2755040 RepID=A0ABS8CE67_9BURK|nr:FUSC family membrane protein [Mesopusillimonas faecipullorum]MCB5363879.1 FUSC family protein [Mesopusillimonas faecipullorum]
MLNSLPSLQRFLYSQYFFSGVRQAGGVLIPALFATLVLHDLSAALVAAIGASCPAILDQPDNPRRHNTNTMLGAILLGTCTVIITGLSFSSGLLFWLIVPLLVFSLSMLSVYGKQGNLMAFASLLVMTLTMRTPLEPQAVMLHTLQSLAGGLFYFCYSFITHRLLWHRETQQHLASALYATAEYVLARSRLYTAPDELDDNYRKLTRAQSAMTDAQQVARNTVLRDLPRQNHADDRQRLTTLSIFTDMVDLLDTLVATHTDYATLHRMLPGHDMMTFARDALVKLADNLQHIALCVARNQPAKEQFSAKAELRAFEYDLEILKQGGLNTQHPEVYALLVQVLRRLRNASRIVTRMALHSQGKNISAPLDARLHQELGRFISSNPIRLGMLTSNLRLDSPHFRYAVRVALATLMGLLIGRSLGLITSGSTWAGVIEIHSYWIILTIVVIMRPGFALTRQRNNLRLIGTGLGSLLALIVLHLTSNPDVMFGILVVSCILGYSMVVTRFMAAAVFNTLTVVLAFQIMSPSSSFIIGERLIDTLIGCLLAAVCSYILPWWEANFMGSLARALLRANQRFLHAGLRYAKAERALQSSAGEDTLALQSERNEAEVAWRLGRKNVHIAFSNFAAAFYRMSNEPVRQQRKVPELNHLLIQNHVLAQQISAAVPQLAQLREIPPGIQLALNTIDTLLAGHEADTGISLETEGELAALAYPLRQMLKAAQLIRQEMRALEPPDEVIPPPRTLAA